MSTLLGGGGAKREIYVTEGEKRKCKRQVLHVRRIETRLQKLPTRKRLEVFKSTAIDTTRLVEKHVDIFLFHL